MAGVEEPVCDIRARTLQLTKALRDSGIDPTLILFLQLPSRLTASKEGLEYVKCKALEMEVPLNRSCVYKAVEDELKEIGFQRFDGPVIIRSF